jgi:hypothetical protein
MKSITFFIVIGLLCLFSYASAIPNQTENASHNVSFNISERTGNVSPNATPTIKLINPNITIATEPTVISTYVPTSTRTPVPVPTIKPTPTKTPAPTDLKSKAVDFMNKYKSSYSIFGAVVLGIFVLYIISVVIRAWKE